MLSDSPISLLNHTAVSPLENNLYKQAGLSEGKFEDRYVKLREKEGRLYPLEELTQLPVVPKSSPYHHEWSIRLKSANRIVSYLSKSNNELKILEVGCGNGWLSNLLSSIPNFQIVGLDVNLFELKQASKAFGKVRNITFVYGNLFDEIFVNNSFDTIVLAASIQYFENPERLLHRLFELLKPGGEIHILDSPLYRKDQIPFASKRSADYFASFGFPEMKDYYFHHSIDSLGPYAVEIMYDPSTFQNRILKKFIDKNRSPFPWIKVRMK